MKIPTYQTLAGQRFFEGSLGKADIRWRVANTMEQEVRGYAKDLENAGFVLQQAKEIPAGSDYPYNVNLFYCYQNGEACVFVFFDASQHTVFITAEPMQALPSAESVAATGEYTPSVTQMAVSGLSFVIQLCDGSFICLDGGRSRETFEQDMYAFLTSKTGGKKPRIALWVFTHPHEDHIYFATSFLRKYREKVDVDAFAYQFADHTKVPLTMENTTKIVADIQAFEESVRLYENAKVYTLHTGQSYYFSGAELEVLYTLDNTYPMQYCSLNDTNAVVRVKFDGGKAVMLMGDQMCTQCRDMAHTYGDYLKSDILQVTHHGLIGGDRWLYEKIDAEICLWPTEKARFDGEWTRQPYQWCLGEGGCDYNAYLRDDSVRKRKHYHMDQIVTIEI